MNYATIALSKNLFFIGSKTRNASDESFFDMNIEDVIKLITPQIVSIQAEMMHYGYILSEECINEMTNLDKQMLDIYALDVLDFLKTRIGDDQFVSLFGDFPTKVMDMSDIEFYTKQFIHYLSDGNYSPIDNIGSEDVNKYNLVIKDTYKVINLATYDDMKELCKTICSANQSLTTYDKSVIEYYCEHWKELSDNIYEVFPRKN